MEVSDDVLSTLGDYAVTLNNLDYSTTQPHVIADILKTFKGEDEDKSFLQFNNWYAETLSWVVCNFAKSGGGGVPFPDKTDDRLTTLACFAAYMSVDLVSNELYLDFLYKYRGPEITMKCIKEAVLVCFDRLCKNLLIEKCWDAVSLRDSIVRAAGFAMDYLTSQGDKLNFEGNEKHDDFIFWFFQGTLTGNLGHTQTFSEILPSTTTSNGDDDDDDVVGLKNDIMKIKERVTESQRKLDIIPIVGMGGIGKTTLARKVYTDREIIIPLFQVRAWTVVSREFCERDVLLGLLESIAPLPDEVYKADTEHLAEILYRRLKGWRYLIVLDDIWTKDAWKRIKLCFPDDKNGSRIILTSRVTEVASYVVDPENPPHIMNLLGVEDSWDLLCKKVYGKKETCPHHLISIGKQIAEKCQGLPLAIEVMAGHLSNINNGEKTQECWEDVAKRVSFPTDVTQMESLSNILSISYNDLPQHLKACFITMVNFPKNFEISVQKLLRLWSAMGIFVQLLQKEENRSNTTEEEVAMNCFENLIGRSLIMVKEKKIDGTAKLCGIHDLLWDLSMTQFRREGHYIFCDKLINNSDYRNDIADDDDKKYVTCISQTLLYSDRSFESDYPINSEMFKLLRVLDILNQSFEDFPVEVTCLFNLRYLALATSGNIPESIFQLSKLETLINYHEMAGQVLPKEIWLLPHLRHLRVGICIYLSDPSPTSNDDGFDQILLSNLQTLFSLSCTSCTKEVFSNIPNLKQLGIDEPQEEDDTGDELLASALENLADLEQLEKLKLYCNPKLERQRCIPEWESFLPSTIKELTLCASNLSWTDINGLSMLPNLEALKLKDNAFQGEEWEMEDDQEFLKLKYLLLDSLDLIFWKASSENFPSLKFLRIKCCHNLCRIPSGFGEIYTLELIDMEFCNQVIYQSAIDIEREQINNLGNDKFILRAGRAHPQLQTSGFVMILIWLAIQLKSLMPKNVFQVKKPRNPSRPKTGKLKLLG